jgi:hypothetical protein
VLVTSDAAGATLSLAHKRLSQAAAEQRVLEEVETTPLIGAVDTHAAAASFLADLALGALPARDLYAAYQSWTDRITALASARITGHYRSPNGSGATTGRAALDEHARLGREIAALRKQAMKETQLARRVDLNLAIRRLSEQLAALTATL